MRPDGRGRDGDRAHGRAGADLGERRRRLGRGGRSGMARAAARSRSTAGLWRQGGRRSELEKSLNSRMLHIVDRRGVAIQRHAPAAVKALNRRAHRETARKHAAVARSKHPIAFAQSVVGAQKARWDWVRRRPSGSPGHWCAAPEPACGSRTSVSSMIRLGVGVDTDDAAHKAALTQDGVAFNDLAIGAGVRQAAVGERAAGVSHCAGENHGQRRDLSWRPEGRVAGRFPRARATA